MASFADDRSTADLPDPSGALAEPGDAADVYLTDGVFLYRIVGSAATGVDDLVELEDCYRLDVVRVPVDDLRSRRLRVVTPPAAAEAGTGRPRSSGSRARRR